MSGDLVSVIMPVYNAEAWLRGRSIRCLYKAMPNWN